MLQSNPAVAAFHSLEAHRFAGPGCCQTSNPQPTQPSPTPPYFTASAGVHATIRELTEKLDRLEARIAPLLRSPGPPKDVNQVCAQAVPNQAEATRELLEMSSRLAILGWRVDDLLDRLDI